MLLEESVGPDLQHVVLAHLSEENNSPEKALQRAAQALHHANASRQVTVHLALQDKPLAPIGVGIRNW